MSYNIMKNITIKEMCDKINDTVCGDGGVILSLIGDYGSFMIPYTDHLFVFEDEDKIIMQDDNDIYININKSSICKSTIYNGEIDTENIILDLNGTKISFLLCK